MVLLLLILLVILFMLDLTLGSVSIPFNEVWMLLTSGESSKKSWEVILLDARLPRALTALVCGVGLSLAGLQMQTLFRNPLAGPYILGISSGASLGIAMALIGFELLGLSLTGINSHWAQMLFAIGGAWMVLGIIFIASLRVRDLMTILIFGIMLGSICMALVSLLQYFSPESKLKAFIIWTMGSLDGVTMGQLLYLGPIALIGAALVAFMIRPLNLLLLGSDYAQSMGLNVRRSRFFIILSTGILAGSITAFCGPIGFVGVVIPHVARLICNSSDHRYLVPMSALVGVNVLLISDIISHLPGSASILPLNSITALMGIPFILWILMRRRLINANF